MDAIESLIFLIYNLEVVIVLSFRSYKLIFFKFFLDQLEPNPKIEGWVGLKFFWVGLGY